MNWMNGRMIMIAAVIGPLEPHVYKCSVIQYRLTSESGKKGPARPDLSLYNFLTLSFPFLALSPYHPLANQGLHHPLVTIIYSSFQGGNSEFRVTKHWYDNRYLRQEKRNSRCRGSTPSTTFLHIDDHALHARLLSSYCIIAHISHRPKITKPNGQSFVSGSCFSSADSNKLFELLHRVGPGGTEPTRTPLTFHRHRCLYCGRRRSAK